MLIVVGVYLAVRLYSTISSYLKISKYLKQTKAKGSFKAYLDSKGIKLTYKTHVDFFYWHNFSQMLLQQEFMSFQDLNYNHVLIIPKGKSESAQWVRLENYILKISDRMMAEAAK